MITTKGSLEDVTARLQRWLPSGWFPTGKPKSRVNISMAGYAAALQPIWDGLQYAKAQARTPTSTDGWLDIRALDFLGDWFGRFPGETDDVFRARFQATLLEKANTRSAVSDAILALTGEAPRIILPWNPADVGVVDGPSYMFLDVDSEVNPARVVQPELRAQFFIQTILPVNTQLQGASVPAVDAQSYVDVWNASLIDLTPASSRGIDAIYETVARLKSEGILAWINLAEGVGFPTNPVSSTMISSVTWSGGLVQDWPTSLEWLTRPQVSSLAQVPVEWGTDSTFVFSDSLTPVEWSNLNSTLGVAPLEWGAVGVISTGLTSQVEWRQGQERLGLAPTEWLGGSTIIRNVVVGMEWGQGQASAGVGPLELLGGRGGLGVSPTSWTADGTIEGNAIGGVEWYANWSYTTQAPLEWHLAVTITVNALAPVEFGGTFQVQRNYIVPTTWSRVTQRDSITPVEWGLDTSGIVTPGQVTGLMLDTSSQESTPGTSVPPAALINASPTPGSPGSGNILTITAGAQIALNGNTLGGANVTELYYDANHTAHQKNTLGDWYGPITSGGTGVAEPDPTGSGGTSSPILTDGLALTQTQVNTIASAINANQVGDGVFECYSGTCFVQTLLAGDVIIATAAYTQLTGNIGSLTDKDGNTWTLVGGTTADGNAPAWWWGGIKLNGAFKINPNDSTAVATAYFIAIRLLNNGEVWVEEAKQGGWWSLTQAQAGNNWPWVNGVRPGLGPDPGAGPNN